MPSFSAAHTTPRTCIPTPSKTRPNPHHHRETLKVPTSAGRAILRTSAHGIGGSKKIFNLDQHSGQDTSSRFLHSFKEESFAPRIWLVAHLQSLPLALVSFSRPVNRVLLAIQVLSYGKKSAEHAWSERAVPPSMPIQVAGQLIQLHSCKRVDGT